MSDAAKPKGHAHQQSVANAAALFGSTGDDPFAALGGIDEREEEQTTSPTAEETAATPTMATLTALPPVETSSLAVSPSNGGNGINMSSSPSNLFASSSPSDLFSASTNEDWLGAQNSQQQAQDYPFQEGHGTHGYEEQSQYNGYAGQYGQQDYGAGGYEQSAAYQEPSTYHQDQNAFLPYEEPNAYQQDANAYQADPNVYQHDEQLRVGQNGENQEQYDQYNNSQQHYDYSQQHSYDPSYYGQDQAGQQYDYSQGEQQGQYAQQPAYNPAAYGANAYDPTTYNAQQQVYQGTPYGGHQQAYDPGSFDAQAYQPYDAAGYSQQEEATYDGAEQVQQSSIVPDVDAQPVKQEHTYGQDLAHGQEQPPLEREGMESGQDAVWQIQGEERAEEAPLVGESQPAPQEYGADQYQFTEDGGVDPYASTNGDSALFAGESADETPATGYEGYAPYNYEGQESKDADSGYTPHNSSQNASSPYAPPPFNGLDVPAVEQYGTGDIAQPLHDSLTYAHYPASKGFEHEAGDETVQAMDDYGGWNAGEGALSPPNQVDTYAASESLRGEGLQEQAYTSGYFDSTAGAQHGNVAERDQSRGIPSLYAPAPSELPRSAGPYDSFPSIDERARDVAEERRRARIPLASFSIDGKLLTFFPTWSPDEAEDAYGVGGAGYGLGRSAAPTKVSMRSLRSVVPPTTYASSKNPLDFPGPALEAGSSQVSALSRATGSTASTSKAKKAGLIRYLNDATSEMASGIGYLAAGKHTVEARRMQDRILILRLLVLLLEHDGAVNNAAFDTAVTELLMADDGAVAGEVAPSLVPSQDPLPGPSTEQKSRLLDQIEVLLVAGRRKEAVDLAVQEKLWTHAVVIASGMDRATWREVVGEFMSSEFDENGGSHQGLKVAYNLFSGQEAKTTYDMFRPKASLSADGSTHSNEGEGTAHLQWRKAVSTILANRSSGDSATLTAIGDGLKLSGWTEAAHICYLLSPATSPMEGYDGPMTRLTLLGASSPDASTSYLRDLDHIILSEVFEYALSLQPIAKGAEAYHGLAYLQPYRLVHAYLLAEMGDVKQAIRYCDSIMTLLKHGKMNRYFHPVLLHQLQELSNRLQGDTKSASWTKKKPTIDGMWGALEGRFTKFIAGEDDGAKDSVGTAKAATGSSTVGPFSHYSAITPDATAGGVSRVQSHADFGASQTLSYMSSRPQSRPGSAVDLGGHRSGISPLTHNFRAASEQSYGEWGADSSRLSSPKQSVGQQSSSDAEMFSGPYTTHATNGAPWYGQEVDTDEFNGQERSLSDSTYYGYQPHGATQPQFASNVDEDLSTAMNGASFDDASTDVLGNAPTPGLVNSYAPPANSSYAPGGADEEEDDLGFGNKSSKSKAGSSAQDGEQEAGKEQSVKGTAGKTENENKPGELKPAASWFGRLWRKDSSTDTAGEQKAKKAHLGEETSFYYDKELKRWVNKKAGDTGPAATPTPPPPRAQTASPSVMGANPATGTLADHAPRSVSSDLRPPPIMSSSSSSSRATPPISEAGEMLGDGSSSPARPPPVNRARSNLADHSQPAALQPGLPPSRPGTSTPEGGPPRSVSASSTAKKKPISKRYVRVD